jgi:hypothetical protein
MEKRKLALFVLLGLTLIYPLTIYYSVQAYELEWTAALEQYPEELRPYVNFHSFIHSSWGGLTIIFGTVIAVSWLILFIWRK